ncbi:MAG TPA: YgiQ family radical SAM protein, partial [Candidatus Wallbacteria bacterium]|nr:YgiQ family radical SAM protein [Candidatus Wallbacteria bacterium]
AQKLKAGAGIENIRGICYISKDPVESYIQLPGHAEAASDKLKFIDMFNEFYKNNDPLTARGLCQKVDTRYLVQAPPAACLPEEKLDEIHDMDFERDVHPFYKKNGAVKALDTIKFSITTHRGCYGECNFCAIAVHQGRTVQSRSEDSIIREAQTISRIPDFKGYILDAGGPTANMYAIECDKKLKSGACRDRRCLFPRKCKKLEINHKRQIELLKKLSRVKGVKKVFVASGIRYDMILCDKTYGNEYMNEIIENHVSGQLKIAPEHTEDRVLSRMGKTGKKDLVEFKDKFYEINKKTGKKQFLTYYIIAAHPGCDESDMKKLKDFASKELHASPEQVQIFTPTPSTYSTLMYYTEKDPFTKEPVFVEKDARKKERQKEIITGR